MHLLAENHKTKEHELTCNAIMAKRTLYLKLLKIVISNR